MSSIEVVIRIDELKGEENQYLTDRLVSSITWESSSDDELEIHPSSGWEEERKRTEKYFLVKNEDTSFVIRAEIECGESCDILLYPIFCDDDAKEALEEIRFLAKETAVLSCWL